MFKPKTCFLALSFVALTAVSIGSVSQAHADYILTVKEVGSNVEATGSGSLFIDGLTNNGSNSGTQAEIFPLFAGITVGSTADAQLWSGISGPTSFGSGFFTVADQSGGAILGINGGGSLIVPLSYTSGTFLGVSTATYLNNTIAGLGADLGTYIWTWGQGATADRFTLQIGESVVAVPEPPTLAILLLGLLSLCFIRRVRKPDASGDCFPREAAAVPGTGLRQGGRNSSPSYRTLHR